MVKPAKSAAAKRPVDQVVEYFFCRNVRCNYHASFLKGSLPATSGIVENQTCPSCGLNTITQIEFTQKSNIPLTVAQPAQALPADPYGGLSLRFGDDDSKTIFEGQINTDPHHQGAHYVGELQRDLLRLGFYGPARGGETVGVFSTMLLGGVLDFKRFLTEQFQVTAEDDLAKVQKAVADQKTEEAKGLAKAQASSSPSAAPPPGQSQAPANPPGASPAPTPTPGAGAADDDQGTSLPIFFPKNGLMSPSEVYSSVPTWGKALGSSTTPTPGLVAATLEKWAALWDRFNRQKSPSDIPTLQANVTQLGATRDTLKSAVTKSAQDGSTLAQQLARLTLARKAGTLVDAQVNPLVAAVDALLAEVNANGTALATAEQDTQAMDAVLPPPSAPATPPQPAPLTLTASTPAAPDPLAPPLAAALTNFDRVVNDESASRAIIKNQRLVVTFIDTKIGKTRTAANTRGQPSSFAGRSSQLEKDLRAQTDAADLVSTTLKTINTDMNAATAAAAALNNRPRTGKPTPSFTNLRNTALTQSAFWVQPAAPAVPGKSPAVSLGPVPALTTRMNTLQAQWQAAGFSAPTEWAGIQATINTLQATITTYRTEIQKSDATTLMDSYVELLREFGQVDVATARYIRRMVINGSLAGIPIFRTPMGKEIIAFNLTTDLPTAVNAAVAAAGRTDAPLPIINFIFKHESGGAHTSSFGGGSPFVKLGIDWSTPGDSSFFRERTTPGSKLSTSRGWGVSAFTTFSKQTQLAITTGLTSNPPNPARGPLTDFEFFAGVPLGTEGGPPPIPLVIASGIESATEGVKVFLSKFKGTQAKRECTFSTRHDCKNCVKNLQLGSPTLENGKPKVKGGMDFFNETEGDFQRELVGGNLRSHRFRSIDRVAQLIQNGLYVIPASTPVPGQKVVPKQVAALTESDTLEFPCSWLTAVTLYAGQGEIAWYYALTAVKKL
ncbi:MAG TPA: hypothetical protein VER96_40485 [Polyangiaceae bacterium]|nr:hypothetical protein [Polyangiaceae bacterium]